MEGMATYTLNVPTSKARLFRSLVKELGGTMVRKRAEKKSCGLDEALEDVKEGRVFKASSAEDLFKQILG